MYYNFFNGKFFIMFFSFFLIGLLLFTDKYGVLNNISGVGGQITTFNVDCDTLPYTDSEIYEQLFDINNVITFDIDMDDSQLILMDKDYVDNTDYIYRKANLYVTIKNTKQNTVYRYLIPEVGIRQKGNWHRAFYSKDNSEVYNLIHFKIDFQQTFTNDNYYSGDSLHNWSDNHQKKLRKSRTFATLKKLNLKWNSNNDRSYIRTYYANEFFRDNGVLSSRVNLCALNLSDNKLGVYTLIEPVDKNFIEKNFSKSDQGGDLYKCARGNLKDDDIISIMNSTDSIGVADDEKGLFYYYDKKTNKKVMKDGEVDHFDLINFIQTLNKNNISKDDISAVVDMDYFLKFVAVSYFVANPDDMRNDYNNYYIYFRKSDNKAIFIPYDNDNSFGVIKNFNNYLGVSILASPYSNVTSKHESQENPLYIHTVDYGGFYVNDYTKVLKDVVKSDYLSKDRFSSIYKIASDNYKSYTVDNKLFKNADYDLSFSDSEGEYNKTFYDYIDGVWDVYNYYVK